MRLLVDATPASITDHIGADAYTRYCGGFITPRARRDPLHFQGVAWGADNDCFSGFNRDAFLRMLNTWQDVPGCLFVAAPDVVGDADATLLRFRLWHKTIKYYGYPVALVAQDGIEDRIIPWTQFDALFIGGTTSWKLSAAVAGLVGETKRRGKHVHMGRVNSNKRLQYAQAIGCDTVDGSSYAIIKYKTRSAITTMRHYQQPLWERLCA